MTNAALAESQAALERRAPFNWSGPSEHFGLGGFIVAAQYGNGVLFKEGMSDPKTLAVLV